MGLAHRILKHRILSPVQGFSYMRDVLSLRKYFLSHNSSRTQWHYSLERQFKGLTYKTGTGRITAYSSIAGKHLQALPEAPHGVRIDEKGARLGIATSVDLVVGEEIVIGAGQPILESSIITTRIPGGNRDIPKDWRMCEIKLRLGDHLRGANDWRWLTANCSYLPVNWQRVLSFCCPHPPRGRGWVRDWSAWQYRGYLTMEVTSISSNHQSPNHN